jgi:enamine deaminase RidA (YjgF/YER057c/UK114 family)
MKTFHLGPWEGDIGYSQSIRTGNRVIVSGTVGDETRDMAGQVETAYRAVIATLAHDGATLKQVVKETIYCRDMDALIACQDRRRELYQGHLPASTWVQVERLYSPAHLVEIEVEAVLED